MNKQEQHDLLIRLDERTRNIWRSVEKIEKGQEEQNGLLQSHETFIRTSIKVIKITAPIALIGILAWLGIKIPRWLQ